jgi:peroxiredoxin
MMRSLLWVLLLGLAMPAASAAPELHRGAPAPQFSRPGFDGKPVALSAYRGKVVLIDFWASWCAPCLAQMPHLIALQARYRARGLQIVGISMDDSLNDAKTVAKRFAFNYPLLLGDAKLGERFGGILGLPVEMLVGRDGKIRAIWRGAVSAAALDKAVAAATS